MPSFVAPNPYGFSGSYYGTPERYEMNRYAYRLGNKEPEPEAAALKAPSQEEAELQQVIFIFLKINGNLLTGVSKMCMCYWSCLHVARKKPNLKTVFLISIKRCSLRPSRNQM